jgi:hypothetical protein
MAETVRLRVSVIITRGEEPSGCTSAHSSKMEEGPNRITTDHAVVPMRRLLIAAGLAQSYGLGDQRESLLADLRDFAVRDFEALRLA